MIYIYGLILKDETVPQRGVRDAYRHRWSQTGQSHVESPSRSRFKPVTYIKTDDAPYPLQARKGGSSYFPSLLIFTCGKIYCTPQRLISIGVLAFMNNIAAVVPDLRVGRV